MECNICLNEDILEKNIVYLGCFHYVCNICFSQLREDSCPFCRQSISQYNPNYVPYSSQREELMFNFDEDLSDEEIYDDFIVPIRMNNIQRSERKRKKILKRQERLNQILNSELSFLESNSVPEYISNPIMIPLPNTKKRKSRKNLISRSL